MATREETNNRAAQIAHAFASFPRFCGLLKIQHKAGGDRIPFVLSATQVAYCKARTSRDIILKGRQVHVTTVEAARDLWWFLTKRGARVVVICQSSTDMGPLRDIAYKFRLFFDSLRECGLALEFGRESETEWSLPGRDSTLRIIQAGASSAAAGKKGRGGTVNRLHLTETSTWEQAEETFNSIIGSVAETGTEVVNESTPKGAAGFYYDQWRAAIGGRSAFKPHFFGWWMNTDYRRALPPGETFAPLDDTEVALLTRGATPEAIAWRRYAIAGRGGDVDSINQEFPNDPETCFLVSGRTFFDAHITTAMLLKASDPIETVRVDRAGARGTLKIWHRATPGSSYVIACDTSEGDGGDAGTAIVRERGTGRHMATLWGQFKPWELAREAAILGRTRYGTLHAPALIAPERNFHGLTFIRALMADERYGAVFHDRDGKPGWNTTQVSRTPALDALETAHRMGHWTTRDADVLGEMRTFIVTDTGRAEAAPGSHDDLVMTEAICWDVLCRPVATRNLRNLPPG